MRTALIVVNYNCLKETKKYVEKLVNCDLVHRIVIVDNNSKSDTEFTELQKLNSEKIIAIKSDENGGYGAGINYGFNFLENNNEEYDYIIISNPDIKIEENAIWECVNFLNKNENAAIVAPRMHDGNNIPIRRSSWKLRTFSLDVIHSTRVLEAIFYYFLRKGEYSNEEYRNKELEVEAISGAFFLIKSSVFKQLGLFDENIFLFYEEDILGHKLKNLEYKTYSLNNISFTHYESTSIKQVFSYYKKIQQLHKSKMYYQKEYNKINKLQVVIFNVLYAFRHIELVIEIPIRLILKK